MTSRPNPLSHPAGYPGSSGANLPAAPALGDAQPFQVSERNRIEQLRQRREPVSRLPFTIVEQVPLFFHADSMLLR